MRVLGKIFALLCIGSFTVSLFTGNTAALANAAIDGAGDAITLTISLLGMMGLWCGVMRVLSAAGLVRRISRMIAPLLRLLFPTAWRTGNGIEEIAANISANLLGIGNAATPFAIRAMEKLELDNPAPGTASDDMVTLAVLNTASISLLPTTLLALRRAAASEKPYMILVPVWICSFCSALLAVLLARLPAMGRRRRR